MTGNGPAGVTQSQICILHRCWLDRVPYDESRYLMALQMRGAPLLKHAAQTS